MLFAFDKATLRIGERLLLPATTWKVREGEHWGVLGPNGSGKSTLLRAVLGDVPVVRGSLTTFCGETWNPPVGWVSFELHREIIAREESRDAARWFSASPDGSGTAGELLLELRPAGP
jgi:ABC-type molybdenum transport system ATPase subunit/photorepair protein PhrA